MRLDADFFQAKLDLLRLHNWEYSEWWYGTAVPFFSSVKDTLHGHVKYFWNTEQSALTPDYCHAHRIITAITSDGSFPIYNSLQAVTSGAIINGVY